MTPESDICKVIFQSEFYQSFEEISYILKMLFMCWEDHDIIYDNLIPFSCLDIFKCYINELLQNTWWYTKTHF